MKKDTLFKLIGKFTLLCLATFLSYKLIYFIGERYFFDKLFYNKSINHGYLIPCGKSCDWTRFGTRAKDYLALLAWIKRPDSTFDKDILGVESNSDFTVALIGDSFVWGQGIRNEERMAELLRSSLNSIKRTRVYSFAAPGDNVIGNYAKFQILSKLIFPNVWVYVFVGNDILPEWFNRYGDVYRKKLEAECPQKILRDVDINTINNYHQLTNQGWETEGNICMMMVFIRSLPVNTLILLTSSYANDRGTSIFLSLLRVTRPEIQVVSPVNLMNDNRFSYLWKNQAENFYVSKKDSHPSSKANLIYTELILKEILQNPRWGFNKK